MKYVDIDSVKVGMILGEDFYDEAGLLFAAKNTKITLEILSRMKRMNQDLVMIADESEIELISEDEKNEIIQTIMETITNATFFGKKHFAPVKLDVLAVINEIVLDDKALAILNDLSKIDDYTIKHSIRVSLLCALISRWQELPEDRFKAAILAGLFHQSGKLGLDKDLLQKQGKLSEEELELVRNYVSQSTKVLDNSEFISSDVLMGILHSTEMCDGSGYPDGIGKSIIHPIAKIVAVANIFDAAINDKCYKKAISPFQIASELFEASLDKLSPKATTPLIKAIESCYLGMNVELSDGRVGEIVFTNKFDPKRPLVKVDGEVIDLARDYKDVSIVRMI